MVSKSFNWQLYVTVIIGFLAFMIGVYNMVTPEMYREMTPPKLGYVFVPDDDTWAGSDFFIHIDFHKSGDEVPVKATAWIAEQQEGAAQPVNLKPIIYNGEETSRWVALLPTHEEKGKRWFYHLTIETSEGRQIEIWKRMNWFEKLFSGFSKTHQSFWVTFEGNVSREMKWGKFWLVIHIVFTLGALFFMFHTLYYALHLISKPNNFVFCRAYTSAFMAWLIFGIGAILIGIPITRATFNVGFQPWPSQGLLDTGDITDTKSLALVVWWGILLLGNLFYYFESAVGNLAIQPMKKFGVAILVAMIVTVIVFLIPHSQFI